MESQAILAAVRRSGVYTNKDNGDWVDHHNFGVSHMGIPPAMWSILSLAFDMFHRCLNYVTLQVEYIRKIF